MACLPYLPAVGNTFVLPFVAAAGPCFKKFREAIPSEAFASLVPHADSISAYEQKLAREGVAASVDIMVHPLFRAEVMPMGSRLLNTLLLPDLKGLREADPEAANFYCEQQLFRIKYEVVVLFVLANVVMGVAAAILFSALIPSALLALLAVGVTITLVNSVEMRVLEELSDRFAIAHATREELEGGLRLWQGIQATRVDLGISESSFTLVRPIGQRIAAIEDRLLKMGPLSEDDEVPEMGQTLPRSPALNNCLRALLGGTPLPAEPSAEVDVEERERVVV